MFHNTAKIISNGTGTIQQIFQYDFPVRVGVRKGLGPKHLLLDLTLRLKSGPKLGEYFLKLGEFFGLRPTRFDRKAMSCI